MDKTIFFYFFSTLAQVFAAVLGVAGLFSVFKLEQLRNQIKQEIQLIGFMLGQQGYLPPGMLGSSPEVLLNYSYNTEWIFNQEEKLRQNIESFAKAMENDGPGTKYLHKDQKDKYEGLVRQINVLREKTSSEKTIRTRMKNPTYGMALIILGSLLVILLTTALSPIWLMAISIGMLIVSFIAGRQAINLIIDCVKT